MTESPDILFLVSAMARPELVESPAGVGAEAGPSSCLRRIFVANPGGVITAPAKAAGSANSPFVAVTAPNRLR